MFNRGLFLSRLSAFNAFLWSYIYSLQGKNGGEVKESHIIDSFDKKSAAINYDYTGYHSDPKIKESMEGKFTEEQKTVAAVWNKDIAELVKEFIDNAIDFHRNITIQNKTNLTADEFYEFIKNDNKVLEKRLAIFMRIYGGQKIYSFIANEFEEKLQFSEEFKQDNIENDLSQINFSNVKYSQNWMKEGDVYSCEVKITIPVLTVSSGYFLLNPDTKKLILVGLEDENIKKDYGKITYLDKEPDPIIEIVMHIELETMTEYLNLKMRKLEVYGYTNDVLHSDHEDYKAQFSSKCILM